MGANRGQLRRRGAAIAIGLTALAAATAAWAQTRQPPYYASIGAGEARMRTGPGRNFPISWLYVRAELPLRVVETYPSWRKVVDPDGTTGWMQANLLSDTRTAVITDGIQPLRERPEPGARILWRAEKGVIGRLSRCGGGWCRFDVRGRAGFVEVAHLWGVDPNESVD